MISQGGFGPPFSWVNAKNENAAEVGEKVVPLGSRAGLHPVAEHELSWVRFKVELAHHVLDVMFENMVA